MIVVPLWLARLVALFNPRSMRVSESGRPAGDGFAVDALPDAAKP